MAEPCAEMADLDVGIRFLPGLDAVEEVPDVSLLAIGAGFAAGAVSLFDTPAFFTHDHGPLVAIERDAEA